MKAPLSVTWEQVAAFRAARHHLRGRAPLKDLLSVLGDMTGAQAQLLSAAQISLWVRIRSLQITDIEKALIDRSLVKATCMRSTLFLVPAHLLGVYARGATRRGEKEIHWARGKGVPDATLEKAMAATLGVLDQPLTRPEIGVLVSQAMGQDPREIYGGGWGSRSKVAAVRVGELTYPIVDLIHLSSARGVICYGPNRDNGPTFVRADAWIKGWQHLSMEEAEVALLRRYLRAYGPASLGDFALWSGLTISQARSSWDSQAIKLMPVDVEGWQATILQEDQDELNHSRFELPQVCLLPYFNSFLLGHKDRVHLVSAQNHAKIYRAQGWIAAVVLSNGRPIAVWSHTRQGSRLTLKVSPFESISKATSAAIRAEADDLGRFLGSPDVDVQFDGEPDRLVA